jgi:hypothetical protein
MHDANVCMGIPHYGLPARQTQIERRRPRGSSDYLLMLALIGITIATIVTAR